MTEWMDETPYPGPHVQPSFWRDPDSDPLGDLKEAMKHLGEAATTATSFLRPFGLLDEAALFEMRARLSVSKPPDTFIKIV